MTGTDSHGLNNNHTIRDLLSCGEVIGVVDPGI